MYAGGDPKIDRLTTTAKDFLCGPDDNSFGITDPTQKGECQTAVQGKVTYAFNQVSGEWEQNLLRLLITGWYANPYDACYDTGPSCFSAIFTGTKPIKFRDFTGDRPLERKAFGANGDADNDYVSWAIAQVRSGHGAEAVALVASSKALEALIAGLNDAQAKAARRLYNQAIADPDVDPVKFDKLADYAKALEKIAGQINDFVKAMDPNKLYIKDVVLDEPGAEDPVTNATVAPDDLYKPESLGFAAGDTLPPEAIEQLTRLFYEARESYKKQTKTANKDVPEAAVTAAAVQTAAAVKEKVAAAKTKIADLAALLNPFTATAQVKDKALEKVILDDGAVMGVPAALIAGVNGARESVPLRHAIQDFWYYEIAAAYAAVKTDTEKEKLVGELVKQFNAYKPEGIFSSQADDVAKAHRIALTRAVSIGADGTPVLEEVPWILPRHVTVDSDNSTVSVAIYRKLTLLYKAAIAEEKGKYEGDGGDKVRARRTLAHQLGARADQFLRYENYADLPVDTGGFSGKLKARGSVLGLKDFMGARFGGFADDGSVKPFRPGRPPATDPTYNELDESGRHVLKFNAVAQVGGFSGQGSNDSLQGIAGGGLTYQYNVTPGFYLGARLDLVGGHAAEPQALSEMQRYTDRPGNAATFFKTKWLAAFLGGKVPFGEKVEGEEPNAFSGKLSLGIIDKRPAGLEGTAISELSPLWYGDPIFGGSSGGLGASGVLGLSLYDERLSLTLNPVLASFVGGALSWANLKTADLDGDGKPDEESYIDPQGGTFGGSFVLEGLPLENKKRLRLGLELGGFGGFGELGSGNAGLMVGALGDVGFDEAGEHRLIGALRYNHTWNADDVSYDQIIPSLLFTGPIHESEDRWRVKYLAGASLGYRFGDQTHDGIDGAGSTPGGSLDDFAVGDPSAGSLIPSGRVSSVGADISVGAKFEFALAGRHVLFVQPQAGPTITGDGGSINVGGYGMLTFGIIPNADPVR